MESIVICIYVIVTFGVYIYIFVCVYIVRDVYRNIPEVAGELKDNCKQLFFKKNEGFLSSNPEPNQLSFTSEDPLGSKSVKSNKFSSDTVCYYIYTRC